MPVFANRVAYESSVFALQQIIIFVCGVYTEHFICVMVPFNNTPYKRMRLTNKINLTKRFSENISACA